MQIQRLQSIYLLLAAIFTGVFCFLPYATASVSADAPTKILVSDTPILFILNATITVLLVITIFMYRNLKQQMKIAILDIALIIGSIITTLIYIYVGNADTVPAFDGGVILLALAESFVVAAYRRMKHDKDLMSSADRIR